MALTLTKVAFSGDYEFCDKNNAELIVDVAWDASYPTGGETFDVSAYFASLHSVNFVPSDAAAEGLAGDYVFAHDKGTAAAGKILAYNEDGTTGIYAQVGDTTDLSALTAVRFRCKGVQLGSFTKASPTSSSNLGAY